MSSPSISAGGGKVSLWSLARRAWKCWADPGQVLQQRPGEAAAAAGAAGHGHCHLPGSFPPPLTKLKMNESSGQGWATKQASKQRYWSKIPISLEFPSSFLGHDMVPGYAAGTCPRLGPRLLPSLLMTEDTLRPPPEPEGPDTWRRGGGWAEATQQDWRLHEVLVKSSASPKSGQPEEAPSAWQAARDRTSEHLPPRAAVWGCCPVPGLSLGSDFRELEQPRSCRTLLVTVGGSAGVCSQSHRDMCQWCGQAQATSPAILG